MGEGRRAVFIRRSVTLALLACLVAVGYSGSAQVARAAGPLPACRYDDVLTKYTSQDDWQKTLLDSIYALPKGYWPQGLVSTSKAGLNAGGSVRRFVIADLSAMASAARKAGAGLRVTSAYRSYNAQKNIYQREVRRYGLKTARKSSARPGHSEHQLGTTIDFGSAKSSKDSWLYSDWAKTAAGGWMQNNAWKYGFVMSYPKNRTNKTCYYYESWHYRYVGRAIAADVHYSGLTLREFLWRSYH